jgi:uncharacterized membrane protein (UPF0127 family)
VRHVRTIRGRVRGMLGTSPAGGVLVLTPARQVHSFGMRYPLDVLFCDRDWVVVHLVRDMSPARVTKWVRRARHAVEMPSRERSADVAPGDALRLESY